MEQRDAPNDETSIAPVASLRSRFEQMNKNNVLQEKSLPRRTKEQDKSVTSTTYPGSRPLTPRTSFAQESISLSSSIEALDRPHLAPQSYPFPRPSAEEPPHSVSATASLSDGRLVDADGQSVQASALDDVKPGIVRQSTNRPIVPKKKPDLIVRAYEESRNGVTTQIVNIDQPRTTRGRMSSDASWVEQIQDQRYSPSEVDSRESLVEMSPQRTRSSLHEFLTNRPKRADSDASWVEKLSNTPPTSAVEKPREYKQELSARGSYLRSESDKRTNQQSRQSPSPTRPRVPQHIDRVPRKSPSPNSQRTKQIDRAPRISPSPTRQRDVKQICRAPLLDAIPKLEPPTARSLPLSSSNDETSKKALRPPTIPAPRRSVDRRQAAPMLDTEKSAQSGLEYVDDFTNHGDDVPGLSTFPDAAATNRRPPRLPKAPWQIPTGYDTRLVVADGGLVCTSGFITRVWDLDTGRQMLDLPHHEALKVTAVALERDSDQLWLGTCVGDILQVDIQSGSVISTAHRAHRGREIVRMCLQSKMLWTVDDGGELNVWSITSSLTQPTASHRVQRGHSASLACDGLLWMATGKDIRVYKPGMAKDTEFFVTKSPLAQENLGDISAATTLPSQIDRVYFGHTDGKISVYNRRRLELVGVVHVSLSKICTLSGVGNYLWTGFGTGTMTIYDTSMAVWNVHKEWSAHDKQVCSIVADASLLATSGLIRVISLALDNNLKVWDGLLKADWLDSRLYREDSRFSTFDEIKVSILTWNAGASKPSHLQSALSDEDQLVEYLRQASSNDILVFGFQELVDLEDKKLTARSIFRSKKKDSYEQEHMTHQYRAWRDYLNHMLVQRKGDQFTLIHSASMIGLFACVFVRSSLHQRIKHVHQAEVKRGMGGLYGNKGALVLRMVIDDSSICFINCHLAAGQTQTSSRNNDVAAILDSSCLPVPMLDELEPSDVFTCGGDGGMILDHEICILNGDLNYRIDTMSRETVIKHVQQGNIARLLERDQLRLSQKKNPVFKLRVFNENDIRFAPTYKYNVSSDIYDTSEKRRSPAWCDRVLYRGVGKVKCDEYRRWEIKTSDHRPVSAAFRCRIKRVDVARREKVMQECLQAFEAYKQELQKRSR